jgi:drug/metabolite transporter (DMT)-like permease
VLFAATLLGEALPPAALVGGVMTLAGVWLTNRTTHVA